MEKNWEKEYRVYRGALGLVSGLHEGATYDFASIHCLLKKRVFEKMRKKLKKGYRVYRSALGLALGLHGMIH